jgi:hypothetical protein
MPLQGGLPALPPPSIHHKPTLTEDEIALEGSLPTLPTLTVTSLNGSQATFHPHTPTAHGSYSGRSVLNTPRKAHQHRALARSPAMANVAYWRQAISGIEEADIRYNAHGEVGCFISQEEADQATSNLGSGLDRGDFTPIRARSGTQRRQLHGVQLQIEKKAQIYTEMMASQASGRITFDGRSALDDDSMDLDDPHQLDDGASHQMDSESNSGRTERASLDGTQDSAMGDDTSHSRASPDDVDFELAMKGEESEDPTVHLPHDDFIYQRVRAYDPNGQPLIDPITGGAFFVHVAKRLEPVQRVERNRFGPQGTLLDLDGYRPPDRTVTTQTVQAWMCRRPWSWVIYRDFLWDVYIAGGLFRYIRS